jgi:hypothetical protein
LYEVARQRILTRQHGAKGLHWRRLPPDPAGAWRAGPAGLGHSGRSRRYPARTVSL